jgi:hypothetical protein
MSDDAEGFPCPSCGFEVFSEPPGSFEICEICGWEDDHVQLRFPALAGGANKLSLHSAARRDCRGLWTRTAGGGNRKEFTRCGLGIPELLDGPGLCSHGHESSPSLLVASTISSTTNRSAADCYKLPPSPALPRATQQFARWIQFCPDARILLPSRLSTQEFREIT